MSNVVLVPKERWGSRPVTVDQLVDELTRINVTVSALKCREGAVIAAIRRKLDQAAGARS
jgi:hypothetical protein